MAALAAAALLDELMGRDRNVAPGERKRETRWDDSEVCKYYLCGFCPSDLFTNTRADLGPCEKIHDENLKKAYCKSTRFERMGYEDDFVRHLQSLLADVERRIKRGHARLALNNTQGMLNQHQPSNPNQEHIEILTGRINELVEEAELLGCEGKVEEAQGVMKLCEQLREEREQLTQVNRRGGMLDEENIKRMEVCQVCGALLVSGDAQQRIDEHISGKQHVGYARIREFIETFKSSKKRSPPVEDKEAQLLAEKEEREKQREKEKEERKKQEEEREREREERHRRHRSRSRSRRRSGSRDRKRSRSRDRRRSRDRDRHSRSHRSRSRSGRSSRERSHRSRSRDRKARKHRDDRDEDSMERNGDREGRDEERPRNPPEPLDPPSDEAEHTTGDTN